MVRSPDGRMTFRPDQYALLDFGGGRKLERFGPYVVDRPCPVADTESRLCPDLWPQASARYDRMSGPSGGWSPAGALPGSWTVSHGPLTLQLRPTPFGHLGVFPEQAPCWDWIAEAVARVGERVKVLNLFAYTGGSTLTAAAAGAEVVHVDAAKNIVARARENAEQSRLGEVRIRWVVEDAVKFVRRELRRGARYDAVVLDPPTYGHGPKGEIWRLAQRLTPLLEMCGELTAGRRAFVLVTCHTPGMGPEKLKTKLADALLGGHRQEIDAGGLRIELAPERALPCGAFACWPGKMTGKTREPR
jgi:23S rRNA (cytosine1962-C5)-methyltransferase